MKRQPCANPTADTSPSSQLGASVTPTNSQSALALAGPSAQETMSPLMATTWPFYIENDCSGVGHN